MNCPIIFAGIFTVRAACRTGGGFPRTLISETSTLIGSSRCFLLLVFASVGWTRPATASTGSSFSPSCVFQSVGTLAACSNATGGSAPLGLCVCVTCGAWPNQSFHSLQNGRQVAIVVEKCVGLNCEVNFLNTYIFIEYNLSH